MGSHDFSYTFNGTDSQLRADLARRQEASRFERGHAYNSGAIGALGTLSIHRSRVFTDEQAAHAYCTENTGKNEGIAVRLRRPQVSFETAKPALAKTLSDAIRAAHAARYDEPNRLLKRIKSAATKTRRCTNCGSTIAVAYLHGLACPVCRHERFCVSATDASRLAALDARVTKAEERLADARRAYAAKADSLDVWYVAGWLAS
jgi:hypothetical protein